MPMHADEIRKEFPHVTAQDLEDLVTGESDWQQAMDRSGDVYIIRWDHEDEEFRVTYI